MGLKSIKSLSNELFVTTSKHLDDVIWKYSVASQFLLKSYESVSNCKASEDSISFGKIDLCFGDEKFESTKLLISKSKILRKLVKEQGLVIEITGEKGEQDFIEKLQNLPGVRSFNSECWLLMSGSAMLAVHRNCNELTSLEVGLLFDDISHEVLLKVLKSLKKLIK